MPWGGWRVTAAYTTLSLEGISFFGARKKGEVRLRKENDEKENEIFMFHFAIRIYFPVSLIQPWDVIKLSVGALGIISEHDVGELGFEAHPAQLDKKREVMAEIN